MHACRSGPVARPRRRRRAAADSPASAPTAADIPANVSPESRWLLETLISGSASDERQAIESLGEMGQRASPIIPFLVRLWEGGDAEVPAEALNAIGTAAVEPCLAAIKRSSGKRRRSIAARISCFRSPRILEAAAELLLRDPDREVRLAVIDSFWRRDNPRFSPSLIKAFRDKDPRVRADAVSHFFLNPDASAIGPLLDALKDENAAVRYRAVDAICMCDVSAPHPDARIASALAAVAANRREDKKLRVHAAGMICGPSAFPPLFEILSDRNESVELRTEAATGLGYAGDAKALPLLLELAKTPGKTPDETHLRYTAAEAVVRLDEQAVDRGVVAAIIECRSFERFKGNDPAKELLEKIAKGKAPAAIGRLAAAAAVRGLEVAAPMVTGPLYGETSVWTTQLLCRLGMLFALLLAMLALLVFLRFRRSGRLK